MILNVIREGAIVNNNNTIDKSKEEVEQEKVQLKRIKQLIDVSKLRYVSENVRRLLDLKFTDDPTCFVDYGNQRETYKVIGNHFRVILYIRLSREDGDLEKGDVSGSIKNQLLFLLDECDRREWDVVAIFCEEDISGADDNRPEWKKCLRFAEVGNTEIVMSKSQSRFTRSMEMVEKYLHKCFPEWNVRFLGLVDHTDTNEIEGKKARQINGLVNEWQVEETSRSTCATLLSMMRNGQFIGSVAPYGYMRDPKDKYHLIPDPVAREAIQLMVDLIKHGMSLKQVATELMKKHILTPADYKESKGIKVYRGKSKIKKIQYEIEQGETLESIADKFFVTVKQIEELNKGASFSEKEIIFVPYVQQWNSKMIRDIVTSEVQTGTLVQGKTKILSLKDQRCIPKDESEWIRVPHCHAANIDYETWKYMVEKFKTKKRNKPDNSGNISLFSKKVFCECCGHTFHKTNSKLKSGENKEYLECYGYKRDKHSCANGTSIGVEQLSSYLLNAIQEQVKKYFDLSKVKQEYFLQNIYVNLDEKISQLNKERIRIENDIETKEKVFAQLYADKVSGLITENEFGIIKNNNVQEIEKMKTRLVDINQEISNINIDKQKQEKNVELFEKYKNIKELNRVVLDEFVKRIEVGKINPETSERNIKIEWNFYTT